MLPPLPFSQRSFVLSVSVPVNIVDTTLAAALAAFPRLRCAGRLWPIARLLRMAVTHRSDGGSGSDGKRRLNSASSASDSTVRPSLRNARIRSIHRAAGSASSSALSAPMFASGALRDSASARKPRAAGGAGTGAPRTLARSRAGLAGACASAGTAGEGSGAAAARGDCSTASRAGAVSA